jgi:hypothetical protein
MNRSSTSARPPGLVRLDVARMLTEEPAPVPWIVEDLVVRGGLTLLAGRAGEGKSMLALAIVAAVVGGETVADFVVAQGRAMLIDAENGYGELHRRLRALGLPRGAADQLCAYEPVEFDLRDLHDLEAAIEAERPDFLVIDSYRSVWGGDEDKSGEAGPSLDRLRTVLRRYDVGALLIHHTTKAGKEYRGSSSIAASCELLFQLDRLPDTRRRSPAPRRFSRSSKNLTSLRPIEPSGGGRLQPPSNTLESESCSTGVPAASRHRSQARSRTASNAGRISAREAGGRQLRGQEAVCRRGLIRDYGRLFRSSEAFVWRRKASEGSPNAPEA